MTILSLTSGLVILFDAGKVYALQDLRWVEIRDTHIVGLGGSLGGVVLTRSERASLLERVGAP